MHFGLIGKTLTHSFSKEYFTQKLKHTGHNRHYDLFELPSIAAFPAVFNETQILKGLNVTIPYKTAIIPYLDELDETAKSIGAVNTIAFHNGKTKGYNTDCFGFEQTLLHHFPLEKQRTALILGTGGSAKAVEYVLQKYKFEITKVSRIATSNSIYYQDVNEAILQQTSLLVNCTPVGMYPNTDDKFAFTLFICLVPTLFHRLNLQPRQNSYSISN
jgi:shikimate dehydrogenase